MNILPTLLNTEPYSDVIATLFNRGDQLLSELKEKDVDHTNEETIIRWNYVMSLIEQSVSAGSDVWCVCCALLSIAVHERTSQSPSHSHHSIMNPHLHALKVDISNQVVLFVCSPSQ